NLGGSIDSYVKLLRKYAASFDDDFGRMSDSLAAGDREAVRRLVHNVVSMAGFLGAIHVRESAAVLDMALRARRGDGEIEALTDALAAAQAALGDALCTLEVPANE
ncbi:MAG: Hpt domain-containing protein, partial [Rhodocyclales bacterium]|nr:Hpt domain-containing protein [Rhodocyclales bacterium]